MGFTPLPVPGKPPKVVGEVVMGVSGDAVPYGFFGGELFVMVPTVLQRSRTFNL